MTAATSTRTSKSSRGFITVPSPLDEVPPTRTTHKPFKSGPILVLPGVHSTDVRYLTLMEVLADELTNAFPSETKPSGLLGANAVGGDFFALRTVAGVSMPAAVPVARNQKLRELNGIKTTDFVSLRHREIARSLVRLMFGKRKLVGAAFQKTASTAIPKFLTSVVYKQAVLDHLLLNRHRLMKMIEADDVHGLRRDFDAVYASFILHRLQADSIKKTENGWESKERLIPTKTFAMSGGLQGTRVPADKTVWLEGHRLDGHFACRRRAVYAFNGVLNYFMTMLLAQPRAYYLSEYEFTFKHTTPDQIKSKLDGYDFVMKFDTASMDTNVPEFGARLFCDEMSTIYTPAFGKLIWAAFTAAYFQPPTSAKALLNNETGFWIGDPSKAGGQVFPGLPSGIAPNPDFGKWWMTFCALAAIDDEFGDVLENLDSVLRGKHEFVGLLDSSDDMVLGVRRTTQTDLWRARLLEEGVSPYMKMTLEGSTFLGNVLYEDQTGETQLSPDIVSFFKNWFVPEHGLDSTARTYWPLGWTARCQHYAKAPTYVEAKYLLDDVWKTTMKGVPTVEQSAYANRHLVDQIQSLSRTDIDAMFLRKPEQLHYALSPADITPELLAHFSLTVSPDRLEPLYRDYYNGQIA